MKSRKDLLITCQFFYPEYVSSAMLPYQTAVGLADAGISVDIICGYPKEYLGEKQNYKKEEVVNNIGIHRINYLKLGRKGFITRLINYFSFTFAMLMRIFRFRKYKAVMVYSNPPILPFITVLAKKLFNCKIIFVSYDVYPEIAIQSNAISKSSIIASVMRKMNKLLYKNVSKVIALSHDMKFFLLHNREITEDKITVIPNWATEDELSHQSVSDEELKTIRKESDLVLSYFGNMGTAQDIETILEVINNEEIKNKKISFLFAGHGNKKEHVREFVRKNELDKVYLFDYLSGEKFEEALSISDLFMVSLEKGISGLAVPSKTYSYYQAKKPVIAIMEEFTDISKELILNKAGIAIGNSQSAELIVSILDIYSDRSSLEKMANNMSNLYFTSYKKEYQIQKYVREVKEIIEE